MTGHNGALPSTKKPELVLRSQVDPGIAERLMEASATGADLVALRTVGRAHHAGSHVSCGSRSMGTSFWGGLDRGM